MSSSTIESVLHENRVFPPSPEFVKQANISGMDAYRALVAEFLKRQKLHDAGGGEPSSTLSNLVPDDLAGEF